MSRKTLFRDVLLHLAIRLVVLAGVAAACALYMYWVEKYDPPYVEPGGYDDTLLGVVFMFLFALLVWVAWLAVETPRLARKGRKASAAANSVLVFAAAMLFILAAVFMLG